MRPTTIQTMSLSSLRVLRLWHWRKVEGNRANARSFEAAARSAAKKGGASAAQQNTKMARRAHEAADFHLKAVQLLNDVVDGTAEEDARGTAQVQLKA